MYVHVHVHVHVCTYVLHVCIMTMYMCITHICVGRGLFSVCVCTVCPDKEAGHYLEHC